MEKRYRLRNEIKIPNLHINKGTIKTKKEWAEIFPYINQDGIDSDWFELIPEEPKEVKLLLANAYYLGYDYVCKEDESRITEEEFQAMQDAINGKFQARIKELEDKISAMFTREETIDFALESNFADEVNLSKWLAQRKEKQL